MAGRRFRKPSARERLFAVLEVVSGGILLVGMAVILPMWMLVGGSIGATVGAAFAFVLAHGPNRVREAILTTASCAVAGAALTGTGAALLLRLSG